jgi:hypothetical protein
MLRVCGQSDSHEWKTWHSRVKAKEQALLADAAAKGKTLTPKAAHALALTLVEAEFESTSERETDTDRQRRDRIAQQRDKLLGFREGYRERNKAVLDAKEAETLQHIEDARRKKFAEAEAEAALKAKPAPNQKKGDRGTKDPNHINYQDPKQYLWTLAHKAVDRNDLPALEKAIQLGIDLTITDKSGWTAEDLAHNMDRNEFVQFFQAIGGAEEIEDDDQEAA